MKVPAKKKKPIRHEFTQKTKDILMLRAGGQCSHPNCNVVTIGPGAKPDEVTKNGEAAHIYSAAANGPRGQGSLTKTQLKSVSNGMWLCKNHARIIDVNAGNGFSPEQLIAWKRVHEERVKVEQGVLSQNSAWLLKLHVSKSPIFDVNQEVYLGKTTILESKNNSVGKTAIAEWLSAVSFDHKLSRWVPSIGGDIKYEIEVLTPTLKTLEVSIDTNSNFDIVSEGKKFASSPIAFEVTFLDSSTFKSISTSSLNDLSCALNVNLLVFTGLVEQVNQNVNRYVKDLNLSIVNNELYCDLGYGAVVFNGLSSGEKVQVYVEFLLAKLNLKSKSTPQLLVIEGTELSQSDLSSFLVYVNSSVINIQTLFTVMTGAITSPPIDVVHYNLEVSAALSKTVIKRM
ncbi:hypothetical protein ACWX0P_01295 [Vibrio mediterranei]